MTIKDAKGQQVYGQNTHFSKAQVDDLVKGTNSSQLSTTLELEFWGLLYLRRSNLL